MTDMPGHRYGDLGRKEKNAMIPRLAKELAEAPQRKGIYPLGSLVNIDVPEFGTRIKTLTVEEWLAVFWEKARHYDWAERWLMDLYTRVYPDLNDWPPEAAIYVREAQHLLDSELPKLEERHIPQGWSSMRKSLRESRSLFYAVENRLNYAAIKVANHLMEVRRRMLA